MQKCAIYSLSISRTRKIINETLIAPSQKIFLMFLLAFIFGLGFCAKANAAACGPAGSTYYVAAAPTGNDSNNGTSSSTPWAHHP